MTKYVAVPEDEKVDLNAIPPTDLFDSEIAAEQALTATGDVAERDGDIFIMHPYSGGGMNRRAW